MDLNAAMDLVHWSHHHRHCYYETIHLQHKMNALLGKVLNALPCETLHEIGFRRFDPLGIWDALTSGLIKVRRLEFTDQGYTTPQMDSLFVFLSTGRSVQEFKLRMWMSEENKVTFVDALIEVSSI